MPLTTNPLVPRVQVRDSDRLPIWQGESRGVFDRQDFACHTAAMDRRKLVLAND